MDNKEIIADIKNALQIPLTTLQLMKNKKLQRNKISVELVDNSIEAIEQMVQLLDKLDK